MFVPDPAVKKAQARIYHGVGEQKFGRAFLGPHGGVHTRQVSPLNCSVRLRLPSYSWIVAGIRATEKNDSSSNVIVFSVQGNGVPLNDSSRYNSFLPGICIDAGLIGRGTNIFC